MAKKGGLNKGLGSLFAENTTETDSPSQIPIMDIEPNLDQPRKEFDPEALEELAESISRYGLLQPLVVRPINGGRYQLVAGERRWRASRIAGLNSVPALVRELSDGETAEIALVENLQREDLNAIEEAAGYKSLMDDFGLTQEEVAARVGRSRPAVTNAIRLLDLPEQVLEMIKKGTISAGHGRALLGFSDKEELLKAAKIASFGANVRKIEQMAKASKKESAKDSRQKKPTRPSIYDEVELSLAENLGRRVKVNMGKGKGTLEIEFYNLEDLKSLANKLGE